jgi:hypothetical protein
MDYTHCWHCGEKISGQGELGNKYFFWCNVKCKAAEEAETIAKRKKKNEKHSPAVGRGDKDMWPELVQIIIHQANNPPNTETNEDGVVVKTGRKCGKCGGTGHNARTCKA